MNGYLWVWLWISGCFCTKSQLSVLCICFNTPRCFAPTQPSVLWAWKSGSGGFLKESTLQG